MTIVAIIPARMGSSRFPGKPLAPLLGRPMIEHVHRRVAMCGLLDAVYVATCDNEIRDAVEGYGGRALMTADTHERASDRIAEAAATIAADIVVMVQGDEPMTTPVMVEHALRPMIADPSIGCVNLIKQIVSDEEFNDRNCIKVVRNELGEALYFSRQPIPYPSLLGFGAVPAYKQVCIIPFRREVLFAYARLAPTPAERAESVDMLRFLEHGHKVHLVETDATSCAVDTPADLARVEALMREDPLVAASLRQVLR